MEEVATTLKVEMFSEEEKRAQRILEDTTIRNRNRFETGLLWKCDQIQLPDSFPMALRRLQCLEKRMNRDPKLRDKLQRQLLVQASINQAAKLSKVEAICFLAKRIPRTQARALSPTDERFLAVANRPEADDPSLYRSEEARGPLSGRNPPAGPSSYRQSSDPVGKPPSRFTTRFIEKQSPSVACPGSIDPAQRSSTHRYEKVRLVWDAAAKVGSIALNSLLLKGPDQLTSLPAVLMRFRQFGVAVSADIREMFHQIRIREKDRHSLRFLWRNNPIDMPGIYVMNVAIFGATCSPASAQFVKNKNAKQFDDQYPRAVEGIVNNHYVDDSLESYSSVAEAIRVSEEMRMIHQNGGFELRNWLSNKEEVLRSLGEIKPFVDKNIGPDNKEFERILGLLWMTKKDELCLATSVQEPIQKLIDEVKRPTKRQVLKCLMGFFDPLGLWSVFLVHGKVLLQDIWRNGTQWDEQIDDAAFERWKKWTGLIPTISENRIPRCYFENATIKHYQKLQLHTFVDASEVAYAAVSYFRITNPDGVVECNLVAAKTKVAPLKPLSVPRLELQAAVLGIRLMQFVEESHTVKIQQRFVWSDSATVLAWLRADPRKYKQFVACRVGELLTASEVREWQWVQSKLNPADLDTKWGKGYAQDVNGAWFSGPEFLKNPEYEWPKQKTTLLSTAEDLRPCHTHHIVTMPVMIFELERFSRLPRLIRSAAYIHRSIINWRRKPKGEESITEYLKSDELRNGLRTIIRLTQWQAFPDEMVLLTRNQQRSEEQQVQLEKSSLLYRLSSMLDEFGILRIDGRITATSNVTESTKFPIILPKKHRFTFLLLDDYHRRFRHCNMETVVNEVRQQYYVPQLRVAVKQVAKACQWCRIYKAKPNMPRMATLPSARLASFQRPLTHTGLDLFGPLLMKIGRGTAKRWVAVFTCLTIRDVHVEVVHSLSTESCIKAIRRFVVRRGSPATIYSDNGTNFRGANRLLEEQIEQLAATFTSTTKKWIFIPPGKPHMGGAWERMERSIKTAMDAAFNSHGQLDDETLVTLVVEAKH
ncbi:uncharacterized protein LOC134206944 [Armigeres subalbatus]|uniref:uncharacterized protein LOC134206944 n=1 Tax=Armigeres subalbatus TaxID=124917 RepID=UPI002ED65040